MEIPESLIIKFRKEFVDLSGDNNPMHTNSTISRRLLFGKPVIHGVYSLLFIMDTFFKETKINNKIDSLNVKFVSPIFHNDKLHVQLDYADEFHKIKVFVGSEIKFVASLKFENEYSKNVSFAFTNKCPKLILPQQVNFDKALGLKYRLNLFLDINKFLKLFPNLNCSLNYNLFSILLASTRSVGVFCPGANSLYSELKISKSDSFKTNFNLIVSKVYKSINLIKMNFESFNYNGQISSFFRQMPKKQIEYNRVKQIVEKNDFINKKVLIIGGSRGLGEISAKILSAGGAFVTITYARGKTEAESIFNEISPTNDNFSILQLDVKKIEEIKIEKFKDYDSILYFATPFIRSNNNDFDQQLFDSFNEFYVKGFKKIYDLACLNGISKIFYPSSIFVDENPPNFKEYVKSKLEGEKLCIKLNKKLSGPYIYSPRLPKLSTDQTAGLYGEFGQDPFPVILKEINKLYN